MLSPLLCAASALYALLLIVVTLSGSARSRTKGYTIGDRNVGVAPTASAIAASFRDGAGIAFWLTFGLTSGYACLWVMIGLLASALIVAKVGPRIRDIASQEGYITIQSVVRDQIGPLSERATAVGGLFMAFAGVAANLFVLALVYESALGAARPLTIIIISVGIWGYLSLGGYGMVMKTDLFQIGVILLTAVIPFLLGVTWTDIKDLPSFFSLSIADSIALFLIAFLFTFADNSTWQRVFAARDRTVLRVGFPLGALAAFCITLPTVWIAFVLKRTPNFTLSEQPLTSLLESPIPSPAVKALFCITVTAMSTSTIDTLVYSFSAMTREHFFYRKNESRGADDYRHLTRLIFLVILAGASIITLFLNDILLFLYQSVSLFYLIAPVFIISALRLTNAAPSTDRIVCTGILFGGIVFGVLSYGKVLSPLLIVPIPAAISALFCGIAVLMGNRYKIKTTLQEVISL